MSALRSYRLLVTWQARKMKMFLPLGIVVQALFALGIVAGYPLLFPRWTGPPSSISPPAARWSP
jgi:hypothetical protein